MREIKFRAWLEKEKIMATYISHTKMASDGLFEITVPFDESGLHHYRIDRGEAVVMQFTGLKDKTGLAEVYEGDLIDKYGNIKGNIYQVDKGETDTVIQGFGTKTWCETYRRAILLGLKDAE